MFRLYRKRVEEGTAKRRRTAPSKPMVATKPDLKLSLEMRKLVEKKALED